MNFRNKVAFGVFFIVLLSSYFVYFFNLNNFVLYGFIVFCMLVFYFVNYWIFKFNIHPKGFLTILPLPSLLLGGYLLFFDVFVRNLQIFWIYIYVFVFLGLEYYLIINQNILNTWLFEQVGLYRAALNINLFYTVLTYFISSLGIFLIQQDFITKILMSLVLFILLLIIFTNLIEIPFRITMLVLISSIFIYFIVLFLFFLGSIKTENVILVSLGLTILFKTFLTNILYHSYASSIDYILVIIESLAFSFLLFLSSL